MSRFGVGFNGVSPVGNDAFTKILLHMDGANGGNVITDDNRGGAAHTWTASGATTTSAAAKFGFTGLNCGAAAGSISTPNSADNTLGSSDWTVDFWFNIQGGAGTSRGTFGQTNGAAWTAIGFLDINNQAVLNTQSGAGSVFITSTAAPSTGVWHHYAAVRNGTSLQLYIDGVSVGSGVVSGSMIANTVPFCVGSNNSGANPFYGFIDEFRLSVGIARWTANFTPPVFPYG